MVLRRRHRSTHTPEGGGRTCSTTFDAHAEDARIAERRRQLRKNPEEAELRAAVLRRELDALK